MINDDAGDGNDDYDPDHYEDGLINAAGTRETFTKHDEHEDFHGDVDDD